MRVAGVYLVTLVTSLLFCCAEAGDHPGHDHGDDHDGDGDDHRHVGHDHGHHHDDETCPSTDYRIEPGEYIEFLPAIPRLTAMTMCMSVVTNEEGIVPGVVASYGTEKQPKLLAVIGEKWGGLKVIRVIVDGKEKRIPMPLSASKKYHICIVLRVSKKEVRVHTDGKASSALAKFPKLKALPGGGTLLVGKAHHDPDLALKSTISDFLMWDRALSADEIADAFNHECTGDEIATLRPQHVMFHGEFVYKEDCQASEYNFDSAGEYVESVIPFPEMDYFTVCVKAATDDSKMVPGTIASYVTGDDNDVLVAGGEMTADGPVLRIMVNGQAELLNSVFGSNTEYRFCVRFHIPQSQVYTFVNGHQIRVIQFKDLGSVPAGGKLVLGQRQTCYKEHGGCFMEGSAFSGKIRNFMVWDRALSDNEIKAIATDEQCPVNPVITSDPPSVLGEGDFFESAACPNLAYTFDNSGGKVEYLESLDTLPTMRYFTVCTRATTDKNGMVPGSVGSYITKDEIDVLTAGGEIGANGKPGLRIAVNGEVVFLETPLATNTEYHFCVLYHLPHGHIYTYVNGGLVREVAVKPGSVPGGGKIVFGQRQDCYKMHEPCFDETRAYTGKNVDFMIWNRALSDSEIKAMAAGTCPVDPLITFSPERVFPAGKFYDYEACPSTEFDLKNVKRLLQYVDVIEPVTFGEYFTICTKVTTDKTGALGGSIGSYVTEDEIDVLHARGEKTADGPLLVVTINGHTESIAGQFAPSTEYSFCLAFHIPHNEVRTYVNGALGTVMPFPALGSLPAGGKLIVGQRQKCYASCFDRKHAFNGKIRNFTVWKRLLSEEEMASFYDSDECPTGYQLTLEADNAKFVKKRL